SFDIADHVRHATLPSPGGHDELCEWAADYWSHRLDRRLPLWDVVLIDGLANGGWALATKTHHCMVDGVGSIGAAYLLVDFSPDASTPPPAAIPRLEPPPSNPLAAVPNLAVKAALAGLGIALHPDRVAGVLRRSRAALDLIVQDELVAAPKTSICN